MSRCFRLLLASSCCVPLLYFLLLLLICSSSKDPPPSSSSPTPDPDQGTGTEETTTFPFPWCLPWLPFPWWNHARDIEVPSVPLPLKKRAKREDFQDKDYSAPGKRLLDNIIHRKIETMTVKIVIALNALRAKIRRNNIKKYTQGWSILIGSWKDIFSKWNLANYTVESVTTLYDYGFLASYGVGFGGPLLLQQVIDPDIDCGLQDFRILIDRYDLQGGVQPFFPSVNKSTVMVVNSKVEEFASVVKARLNCILEHDHDMVEAAEVGWNLDEVIRAMKMRLSYEVEFPTADEN